MELYDGEFIYRSSKTKLKCAVAKARFSKQISRRNFVLAQSANMYR